MSKHYPPVFMRKEYHCPYCNVYASQDFHQLPMGLNWNVYCDAWRSRCGHCKQDSYWLDSATVPGKLLAPASYGTPAPAEYMPDEVRTDYVEASAIFTMSPRGAAALLRLAVQKLMVHLGMKGDNINNDIKTLVASGLPVTVQQALDYCRVVGNNAVHPGEINLDDTPEMAWTMFEMINVIVQLKIAAPKQLEELYGKLPEAARAAISKRDAAKPA